MRRSFVFNHVQGRPFHLLQYCYKDMMKESARWTVAKYLDYWLQTVKPTVEPNTYGPYERHCRLHLIPVIGHVPLSKLDEAHVEGLYSTLASKEVSPIMQRKIGTTLTVALERQVGKALGYNPASKVAKPLATKKEMQVLDPDQLSAFIQEAESDRFFPLYLLLLDSGMRPGEVLALEWPDIDFGSGFVSVTKSLEQIGDKQRVKPVKTKKSNRRIDLSARTLAVLQEHRKRSMAEGLIASPVFHNRKGGHVRISDLHKDSFKPILKRAELPDIRLYDLRHTCATLLLLADQNPKVVSERLGHSTITLTLDTYSHVLPTMQKKAALVMNQLLAPRVLVVNG